MTAAPPEIAQLQAIRTFPELIAYLRDQLDWPIDEDLAEDQASFERGHEVGLPYLQSARLKRVQVLKRVLNASILS